MPTLSVNEGGTVKARRMLYAVALLALCFVFGCSGNPGTPAASTENPNAAGGSAGSGGGSTERVILDAQPISGRDANYRAFGRDAQLQG